MPAEIRVVGMHEPVHEIVGSAPYYVVVNTTSRAENSWERDLSPFHLGPCNLYGGFTALRVENA